MNIWQSIWEKCKKYTKNKLGTHCEHHLEHYWKIWGNKTPKNLQVLAFPTHTPPTNQRLDVIHEVLRTMNVFTIVSSVPRTQIKQEEIMITPPSNLSNWCMSKIHRLIKYFLRGSMLMTEHLSTQGRLNQRGGVSCYGVQTKLEPLLLAHLT